MAACLNAPEGGTARCMPSLQRLQRLFIQRVELLHLKQGKGGVDWATRQRPVLAGTNCRGISARDGIHTSSPARL